MIDENALRDEMLVKVQKLASFQYLFTPPSTNIFSFVDYICSF